MLDYADYRYLIMCMQSYNNWRRLQKRRGMQVRREVVMDLLG
ncbi:hypothetical protein HMPREF1991_00702 [Hoylesella loescheii DSM 19665 = JCM 12249 = ATCC 15930]|uniref:Uncharacterized protein n=1 Tax=Hoylesella loescheii DSM 19665 = JCM 12249 = ATCC 15930 TaxID=1122985 RepID=A0A069QKR1_HOYLO|nr:hypothetical protein HMPREF1991_00702 [Hoylesella loescheii DSM 19665 = JCM 12249 = ATCC 15930]